MMLQILNMQIDKDMHIDTDTCQGVSIAFASRVPTQLTSA